MNDEFIDLEKRVDALEDAFKNISLDNVAGEIIEETTASTANTQRLVSHNLGVEPKGYIILFGDVYIEDFDEEKIDVRSVKTSESFKIKVLR